MITETDGNMLRQGQTWNCRERRQHVVAWTKIASRDRRHRPLPTCVHPLIIIIIQSEKIFISDIRQHVEALSNMVSMDRRQYVEEWTNMTSRDRWQYVEAWTDITSRDRRQQALSTYGHHFIIIIWPEMLSISYCSGLGHETTLCVYFTMFLRILHIVIFHYTSSHYTLIHYILSLYNVYRHLL